MTPTRGELVQASKVRRIERDRIEDARAAQLPSLAEFRALLRELDPDRLQRSEVIAIQAELVDQLRTGKRMTQASFAPFWDALNQARLTDMERLRRSAAYRWITEQPGIDRGLTAMTVGVRRRKESRPLLPGDPVQSALPQLPMLLKRPSRKEALAGLMPEQIAELRSSGELEPVIARERSYEALAARLDRALSKLRDQHAAQYLIPLIRAYSSYCYIDQVGRLRHIEQEFRGVGDQWLELAERMERAAAWTFESTLPLAQMLKDEAKHLRVRQKTYARVLAAHAGVFEAVRHADTSAADRELLKQLFDGLTMQGWKPSRNSLMHFFDVVAVDAVRGNSWFSNQLALFRRGPIRRSH